MSVLERITQRGSQNPHSPIPGQSSTLAAAEPVTPELQRIQFVMDHLLGKLKDGSDKNNKLAILLQRVAAEAIHDLEDVPSEFLEEYFQQTAAMFFWGATGQVILNVPLPPGFVPPAELSDQAYRDTISAKPDPAEIDAAHKALVGSVTETD